MGFKPWMLVVALRGVFSVLCSVRYWSCGCGGRVGGGGEGAAAAGELHVLALEAPWAGGGPWRPTGGGGICLRGGGCSGYGIGLEVGVGGCGPSTAAAALVDAFFALPSGSGSGAGLRAGCGGGVAGGCHVVRVGGGRHRICAGAATILYGGGGHTPSSMTC